MNTNTNSNAPNSRLNFASMVAPKSAPSMRIFMQVENIVTYSDFPTVAYGTDLKTKKKIAIRLTNTEERSQDLQKIYKSLDPIQAMQRAKREYMGASKRESLDDKRDKRYARFLTFDHCVKLEPLNDGTLFYRSHWSELVSSNPLCTIFEGVAHLYLNPQKNIAMVKVIEFIKDLPLDNVEKNKQTILTTLKNKYRNGLKRMGSCVLQIIDSENNVIAEPSIFQTYHTEPFKNKDGDTLQIAVYGTEQESLNAFMTDNPADPKDYHINNDLGRIGISVLAGIPFDFKNLAYKSNEYLHIMKDAQDKFKSGAYTIRVVSLNEIFCGPERRNTLFKKMGNKSIVSNYTQVEYIKSDDPNEPDFERTIALYVPTVFAIHYHKDSGNPFVAYSIISEQFSNFKPSPLWKMENSLQGYKYQILHNDHA